MVAEAMKMYQFCDRGGGRLWQRSVWCQARAMAERGQTDSPCFVVDLEPIREFELAFGDDDVGHPADLMCF
jgi:hypothetical protein